MKVYISFQEVYVIFQRGLGLQEWKSLSHYTAVLPAYVLIVVDLCPDQSLNRRNIHTIII